VCAEGVYVALEHPNATLGLSAAALLLALPPSRRALWNGTFGRLRSDASKLASAERRLAHQTQALAEQSHELRKLAERSALASDEYGRGRAKLLAAGGQLRQLAASARKQEQRLVALLDDVRHLKLAAGASAPLLQDAAAQARVATAARVEVERSLRRVASLVPI
jgi:hypothetical protein